MKKKKSTKVSRKPVKKSVPHNSSSSIKIRPFGDRILIKPFTQEEVNKDVNNHFGIIMPDTVSKEKAAQGKVLAVGEGRWEEGKLIPVRVKVGDVVVFSKYGYDEIEQDGEEYYLLKEDSILAVIK